MIHDGNLSVKKRNVSISGTRVSDMNGSCKNEQYVHVQFFGFVPQAVKACIVRGH